MKKVSIYGTRDEVSIGRAPASARPWLSLARAMVADACREGSLAWFGTFQGKLIMEALEYTPSTIGRLLHCSETGVPKKANNRQLHNFRGRMMSISQIAEETGIHAATIRNRINRGESLEQATNDNIVRQKNQLLYPWKGKSMTLKQIGEMEGISARHLIHRISHGWDLGRAVNEQLQSPNGRRRR